MKIQDIKTALITGATSGIGFSFAKILAANSVNLVLASRNIERMKEIKPTFEEEFKIRVFTVECDLSKIDGHKSITDFLDSNSIEIDLLINNAGSGVYGKFKNTSLISEQDSIRLNIESVTALSKYFLLKYSSNHQERGILNVASTLAFRKSPDWSVYSASKAYILSFTRTLALELKASSMKIAVLCPGKTDTEFDLRSGYNSTYSGKMDSSDNVADYALKALFNGRILIIPGFINKLKYLTFKYLPDFITDRIISK